MSKINPLYIEVFVPSQPGKWSSMCVSSIDFCFCISTIFLLDFRTVPTVWYFIFDGCDSIVTMTRFNPATFMFLSQARIYNPIGFYRGH